MRTRTEPAFAQPRFSPLPNFTVTLDSRCVSPRCDHWMHVTNAAAQNRLDDVRKAPKGARGAIWNGVPRRWPSLTAIALHCCTMTSKACQAGLFSHDSTLHGERWWNKRFSDRLVSASSLATVGCY